MIFNMSQGGVAYISVTAPSGASIVASCQGERVTGTGTCILEVHVIGNWEVVCTLNNQPETKYADIPSFGAEESVSFSYSSTIHVSTHPGAYVKATLGEYYIDGNANSSGVIDLTVPAGKLGNYSVTANNGAITSPAGTANVDSYGITRDVSLLQNVPIIEFNFSGTVRTYKGAAVDYTNQVKVSPSGDGWKAWIRASCAVTFKFLTTRVSICAVAKGGKGAVASPGHPYENAGGGGAGGSVVNATSQSISVDTAYTVTIADNSSFGSLAVASKGNDASGISGGSGTSSSSAGGGGASANDAAYPSPSYDSHGNGAGGRHAFNDSSFDGIEYAHGGCGGETPRGGAGAGDTTGVYANPGAGGAGAGTSNWIGWTYGITGIVLMRSA